MAWRAAAYLASKFVPLCVSREFITLARGKTSPMVTWLRAFPVKPSRRRTIDISRADLDVVKNRCATQGLEVLGLRLKGDRLVPGQRFDFLRAELGDAFDAVELDDASANPEAAMPPHSLVTEHLIDEPGQPTRAALDQVLELFRSRLLTV